MSNSDRGPVIGASAYFPGRNFDGKIDDIRIWNDTRTAAEIRENMHHKLAGNEANLVAYYTFDAVTTVNGTSGEVADDQTDGTHSGAATGGMISGDIVTSTSFVVNGTTSTHLNHQNLDHA